MKLAPTLTVTERKAEVDRLWQIVALIDAHPCAGLIGSIRDAVVHTAQQIEPFLAEHQEAA